MSAADGLITDGCRAAAAAAGHRASHHNSFTFNKLPSPQLLCSPRQWADPRREIMKWNEMVKVNVGQRCPSGLFATPAPTTAQHQVGGKIKSWHWNSFIVCGKLNLSLINWIYRWIWNTFPKMYEGNTVLPAGQEYNSWIFIFLQNLLGVFNK